LSGDIEYELACKKTKLITPVPGGIGPITLAFLIKNVVKSWLINNNIKNDL
jgi:methylenetetrahydrofolate dehydrogenase (NADP+)/methenyltetrahydrofolate cyclohydrolase